MATGVLAGSLTATDGCACDCTGTGFYGNNCENVGDTTKDGGGAIYASGVQLTIEDTQFVENKVDNSKVGGRRALNQGRGGGICAYKSTVIIKAGVFQRNTVTHEGLGGAIFGEDSTFQIQSTIFKENSALSGGAIRAQASEDAGATCDVNVEQSEFTKNDAAHFGGAISIHFCTALISGSSFTRNKASGSSAVRMVTKRKKVGDTYQNVQQVRDGVVRGGSGGAVHVLGSAVTVRTSTFYSNEAISCNNFGAGGTNFGGFPIFDIPNSDSKLGFCCNSFHGQQSVDTCMLQSVVDEKAAAGSIDIADTDKFRSTCLSQGGLGGGIFVEKHPLASNLAVVATTFTHDAATTGAAIHATSVGVSVEYSMFQVKNKFAGGVGEANMDDTAAPGSQDVCNSGPGLVEGCEDRAETSASMAAFGHPPGCPFDALIWTKSIPETRSECPKLQPFPFRVRTLEAFTNVDSTQVFKAWGDPICLTQAELTVECELLLPYRGTSTGAPAPPSTGGTVQCPGKPSYCDCDGDCGGPLCSCTEADACCGRGGNLAGGTDSSDPIESYDIDNACPSTCGKCIQVADTVADIVADTGSASNNHPTVYAKDVVATISSTTFERKDVHNDAMVLRYIQLDEPRDQNGGSSFKIFNTTFASFQERNSVFIGGGLGGCLQNPCAKGYMCGYMQYSLSCELCPAGTVSIDGISCSACTAGAGPSADQSSCLACEGTTYSIVGQCLDCALPNVVDSGHQSCTACAAGKKPSAHQDACVDCVGATYSAFGIECSACEPPRVVSVSANGARIGCSACLAGEGPTEDVTACEACTGKTYSTIGICQDCLEPSAVNTAHTACAPPFSCLGGTSCPTDVDCNHISQCVRCIVGSVSIGILPCEPCTEQGKVANFGQAVCEACSGGSQPDVNRSQCVHCEGNTFSTFGITCVVCPDGKLQESCKKAQ
jgi:predicted outer membrane repeat protein